MQPLDWPIILNAIFVGVVLLLGAVVAAVVSNRASKSLAKKTDLQTLEDYYNALRKNHLEEVERLSNKQVHLQNENDALRNKQVTDKIECQKQISELVIQNIELQRQLTVVLMKIPDPGTVSKVVIVGADIPKDADGKPISPVPAIIVGPLPLPTTAAERAAAAIAAAKGEADARNSAQ